MCRTRPPGLPLRARDASVSAPGCRSAQRELTGAWACTTSPRSARKARNHDRGRTVWMVPSGRQCARGDRESRRVLPVHGAKLIGSLLAVGDGRRSIDVRRPCSTEQIERMRSWSHPPGLNLVEVEPVGRGIRGTGRNDEKPAGLEHDQPLLLGGPRRNGRGTHVHGRGRVYRFATAEVFGRACRAAAPLLLRKRRCRPQR